MSEAFTQRLDGPAPAMEIAQDIVRRGLLITPVLVLIAGAIWGFNGAASAAYGCAIVLANFMLSAFMLSAGARISFAMMGAAALFGYLIRLGLIFLAVYVVKDQPWIDMVALGITLIVTHLGLLFWEMRFISGSLAYPGLKPPDKQRTGPTGDSTVGSTDSQRNKEQTNR
jgi:hypothetical protein